MARIASPDELHETIGHIYDSTLDPERWPVALKAMCAIFDAIQGSITVLDSTANSIRFATEWTDDPHWPHWRKLLDEKYAAQMPFFQVLRKYETSEVYNTEMLAERGGIADVYNMPFFRDWALPAGRRDTIGSVILKSPSRFGIFALHTSTQRDVVSREELELAAYLVPHVRRAVAIGDLLSVHRAQAETLKATLDKVGAAVIVTDARSHIVHANANGEAMLRDGGPIASVGGQLVSLQANATTALRHAISQAEDPVHKLASHGIGVPLRCKDGKPAIAHVMPLTTGSAAKGFGQRAAAAVFVTTSASPVPAAEALIALFGLTQTEARVLLEIAKGHRRADAATALGIADSTAKTHLERVYSKTGTNDQASLTRLVASLSPPVIPGR